MKALICASLIWVIALVPASAGTPMIELQTDVGTLRTVSYQLRMGNSTCSAVAYTPQALLTAAHCGEPGQPVEIWDQGKFVAKGTFGAADDNADVMVVLVPEGTFKTWITVAAANVVQDTPVVVVGYPLGIAEFAVYGFVQDVQVDKAAERGKKVQKTKKLANGQDFEVYVVSAQVAFGNSGGGVFAKIDGEWQLIGICSMGAFGYGALTTYIGLFVSTKEVQDFLKPR